MGRNEKMNAARAVRGSEKRERLERENVMGRHVSYGKERENALGRKKTHVREQREEAREQREGAKKRRERKIYGLKRENNEKKRGSKYGDGGPIHRGFTLRGPSPRIPQPLCDNSAY